MLHTQRPLVNRREKIPQYSLAHLFASPEFKLLFPAEPSPPAPIRLAMPVSMTSKTAAQTIKPCLLGQCFGQSSPHDLSNSSCDQGFSLPLIPNSFPCIIANVNPLDLHLAKPLIPAPLHNPTARRHLWQVCYRLAERVNLFIRSFGAQVQPILAPTSILGALIKALSAAIFHGHADCPRLLPPASSTASSAFRGVSSIACLRLWRIFIRLAEWRLACYAW